MSETDIWREAAQIAEKDAQLWQEKAERLKAENASLLDKLGEARSDAAKLPMARKQRASAEQRAEAAEKLNTELQGALRAAAAALHEVLCVGLDEGQGLSSQEKRAARVWRQVSEAEIAARAALHDEERSAPPREEK